MLTLNQRRAIALGSIKLFHELGISGSSQWPNCIKIATCTITIQKVLVQTNIFLVKLPVMSLV